MSRMKEAEGSSARREEAESGSGPPLPHPPIAPADEAAVGELVSAMNLRRLYRDVTLALRSGLRDAMADFSFVRTRGLRNLLKFFRSIAGSDESIRLFRHSQTIPELRGLPFDVYLCESQLSRVPILMHSPYEL
ncbi:hypothetical protein GW17_00009138 [Ensete ventricosum]|uniref:Uncharacterized protein n=1 Tax=Ensete ventricosum TaxID=4639 RepID=A0A444FV26_ENSVE|nr:hypothetical protein B296_00032091 [Ensete ventricosum]RWW26475.1 hypothetical protein GW17_00009138 [Ensete ventricosum]